MLLIISAALLVICALVGFLTGCLDPLVVTALCVAANLLLALSITLDTLRNR